MLYGNSFADQACLIKMAGYQPRPFLRFFMDQDFVLEDKNAEKKRTRPTSRYRNLILSQ